MKRKTKAELKEMIVELRVDVVNKTIPDGHCPYAYYSPTIRSADCTTIPCEECRENFLVHVRNEAIKEMRTI